MSGVRVFFDTNVLVSAFLARGLCADLLRLVLREHSLLTPVCWVLIACPQARPRSPMPTCSPWPWTMAARW